MWTGKKGARSKPNGEEGRGVWSKTKSLSATTVFLD